MAIPRATVAVRAGVGIMWVFVTLDTIGGCWEVHRPRLPGLLDAHMAFVAVDPFDDVCTVFECAVLFLPFET
jgi:hypothetical protein